MFPLLYHKKPLLSVKLAQDLAEQPFGEYAAAFVPPDVRGVFHRECLGGEGAVGCGEERRVNRRIAGGVDLARREAAAKLTERRALRELRREEVDLSARRLDAKTRLSLALFRLRLRVTPSAQ